MMTIFIEQHLNFLKKKRIASIKTLTKRYSLYSTTNISIIIQKKSPTNDLIGDQ